MNQKFAFVITLLIIQGFVLAGEDAKEEGRVNKETLARQTELVNRVLDAISDNSADKLEKCVTRQTLFWKDFSPGEGGFGTKGPEKMALQKWLTKASETYRKAEMEKSFQETDRGYVCEVRWAGKKPDVMISLTITMHEFGQDGWRATALCIGEYGLRNK